MMLKEFSYGFALVMLEPTDCVRLAQVCDEADDAFSGYEEHEMQMAVRTYASLFRALAVGSIAYGHMLSEEQASFLGELAEMGFDTLIADARPEVSTQKDPAD